MHFLGSNATEMRWQPGLHPGPRWGSLQRSPGPVAGFEGGEKGVGGGKGKVGRGRGGGVKKVG